MHIPTHILSGWCVGNLFNLTPRERLFCMMSASLADVDGLTIAFGEAAYQQTHHLLAHNLPFALMLSAVLTAWSVNRTKVFALYLALAHVHLVLDYFGSGPHWPIYYLWPIDWEYKALNRSAWPFYSWQNISVALAFIGWTLIIAVKCGRTPIELIAPRLDRDFANGLRRLVGRSPGPTR